MRFLREFFIFGLVGTVGFFVDSVVLYVLRSYMGPYIARGFSFLSAVFITWLLNRTITFINKPSGLKKRKEFFSYLILMLAGGFINYVVYAWLVFSYQSVEDNLVIGVAAGSLAGMTVNFFMSRHMLFRRRSD